MLVDIGKTGFIPSFGLEFSVELLSPGEEIEYQCFDAPPTEDGWTPVGKCHATEELCDAACPVVPFCQCEEPNVLGNELTMTLQDVESTGFLPTNPEYFSCTPEEVIEQIKALYWAGPFFFWRWQGIPEKCIATTRRRF